MRAIALLADQRPVLKIMPEAFGPEAFADSEELARVTEFLSTVKELELLTRLDFGAAIRKADIRSGRSSPVSALDLDPQALQNPPAGGGSDTRGRSRRPKKS